MVKDVVTRKFGDKDVGIIADYSDERMVFIDN